MGQFISLFELIIFILASLTSLLIYVLIKTVYQTLKNK